MWNGQEMSLISRLGMESYFSAALAANPEMTAFYDNKKKEYALYFRGDEGVLFSSQFGSWVSILPESPTVTTYGGCRIGDDMVLLGASAANNIYSGLLYTGDVARWWSQQFSPTVKFYVNAEPDIVKTFDGFTIVSDRTVDPQNFVVTTSDGSLSTANLSSAVVNDKEGTFRLKNLRDASNARSRGVYGELELDLILTSQSGMTSVLTKYRPSFKPL